jgi:hypothetical protein
MLHKTKTITRTSEQTNQLLVATSAFIKTIDLLLRATSKNVAAVPSMLGGH